METCARRATTVQVEPVSKLPVRMGLTMLRLVLLTLASVFPVLPTRYAMVLPLVNLQAIVQQASTA